MTINTTLAVIKGYEQEYRIDTKGNVVSLNYKNKGVQGNLKIFLNQHGYQYVVLSSKGNTKYFLVHRLVAQAFIPNPNNKPCVNHINGIKNDNRLENLEWCTRSENSRHAFDVLGHKSHFSYNHPKTSLGKTGVLSISSKKVIQLNKLGEEMKTWNSMMDIERILGINHSCIIRSCNGKQKTAGGFIWKYITY